MTLRTGEASAYLGVFWLEGVHITHSQHPSLWEERYVVFKADTSEQALDQARSLGRSAEVSYDVIDGSKGQETGRLQWSCKHIQVVPVVGLSVDRPLEIYSRFIEDERVIALLVGEYDVQRALRWSAQ